MNWDRQSNPAHTSTHAPTHTDMPAWQVPGYGGRTGGQTGQDTAGRQGYPAFSSGSLGHVASGPASSTSFLPPPPPLVRFAVTTSAQSTSNLGQGAFPPNRVSPNYPMVSQPGFRPEPLQQVPVSRQPHPQTRNTGSRPQPAHQQPPQPGPHFGFLPNQQDQPRQNQPQLAGFSTPHSFSGGGMNSTSLGPQMTRQPNQHLHPSPNHPSEHFPPVQQPFQHSQHQMPPPQMQHEKGQIQPSQFHPVSTRMQTGVMFPPNLGIPRQTFSQPRMPASNGSVQQHPPAHTQVSKMFPQSMGQPRQTFAQPSQIPAKMPTPAHQAQAGPLPRPPPYKPRAPTPSATINQASQQSGFNRYSQPAHRSDPSQMVRPPQSRYTNPEELIHYKNITNVNSSAGQHRPSPEVMNALSNLQNLNPDAAMRILSTFAMHQVQKDRQQSSQPASSTPTNIPQPSSSDDTSLIRSAFVLQKGTQAEQNEPSDKAILGRWYAQPSQDMDQVMAATSVPIVSQSEPVSSPPVHPTLPVNSPTSLTPNIHSTSTVQPPSDLHVHQPSGQAKVSTHSAPDKLQVSDRAAPIEQSPQAAVHQSSAQGELQLPVAERTINNPSPQPVHREQSAPTTVHQSGDLNTVNQPHAQTGSSNDDDVIIPSLQTDTVIEYKVVDLLRYLNKFYGRYQEECRKSIEGEVNPPVEEAAKEDPAQGNIKPERVEPDIVNEKEGSLPDAGFLLETSRRVNEELMQMGRQFEEQILEFDTPGDTPGRLMEIEQDNLHNARGTLDTATVQRTDSTEDIEHDRKDEPILEYDNPEENVEDIKAGRTNSYIQNPFAFMSTDPEPETAVNRGRPASGKKRKRDISDVENDPAATGSNKKSRGARGGGRGRGGRARGKRGSGVSRQTSNVQGKGKKTEHKDMSPQKPNTPAGPVKAMRGGRGRGGRGRGRGGQLRGRGRGGKTVEASISKQTTLDKYLDGPDPTSKDVPLADVNVPKDNKTKHAQGDMSDTEGKSGKRKIKTARGKKKKNDEVKSIIADKCKEPEQEASVTGHDKMETDEYDIETSRNTTELVEDSDILTSNKTKNAQGDMSNTEGKSGKRKIKTARGKRKKNDEDRSKIVDICKEPEQVASVTGHDKMETDEHDTETSRNTTEIVKDSNILTSTDSITSDRKETSKKISQKTVPDESEKVNSEIIKKVNEATSADYDRHVSKEKIPEDVSTASEVSDISAATTVVPVETIVISDSYKMTWIRFHGKVTTRLITPEGFFFLVKEIFRRCFRIQAAEKRIQMIKIQRIMKSVLKIKETKLDQRMLPFVIKNLQDRKVIKTVPETFMMITEGDAMALFHHIYKDKYCEDGCTSVFYKEVSGSSSASVSGKGDQKQEPVTPAKDQLGTEDKRTPEKESVNLVKDRNIFDVIVGGNEPINLCSESDEDGYDTDKTLPYVDGCPQDKVTVKEKDDHADYKVCDEAVKVSVVGDMKNFLNSSSSVNEKETVIVLDSDDSDEENENPPGNVTITEDNSNETNTEILEDKEPSDEGKTESLQQNQSSSSFSVYGKPGDDLIDPLECIKKLSDTLVNESKKTVTKVAAKKASDSEVVIIDCEDEENGTNESGKSEQVLSLARQNSQKYRTHSGDSNKLKNPETLSEKSSDGEIDIEVKGRLGSTEIPFRPICALKDTDIMAYDRKVRQCIEKANQTKDMEELADVCYEVLEFTKPLEDLTKKYLSEIDRFAITEGTIVEEERKQLLDELSSRREPIITNLETAEDSRPPVVDGDPTEMDNGT